MSNADAIRAALEGDPFEIALALDAALVAFQRREYRVHAPVDGVLVALIAATLRGHALPRDLYERIRAIAGIVDELPATRRAELVDLLVADRVRVPWRPMRGAQALTYELTSSVDVVLAAGGAGSGKTEAVLGAALFQSRNARFLRKTSLEFTPLLRRIAELVGNTDGRNLKDQLWTLPPPFGFGGKGCTVEFTSVNDPDSHLRAQGRAVDGLFPDDVGNSGVSRESIFFIANWLRSAELIPKKLVMTSNPPSSHDALWLREFFAPWLDPGYPGERAQSGEVRYFVPEGDKSIEVPAGTPGAQSRTVVMSTVYDNPRLLRSGYLRTLQNAPTELLRRRLLENDWSAGFDQDADLQVIPGAWVDAAMERWRPDPPTGAGLDAIGVDVARGGKDRSAIIARHDTWFGTPIVRPGSATPDGPTLAALVLEQMQPGAIAFVDATGVGGAVVDALRAHTSRVVPIIFGARYEALDRTRSFGFANVRSGLWWRMRELLDPTNPRPIALPPDRVLRAELTAPRYELRGGRIYVESREELIARLGHSPDIATALVLAAIEPSSTLAAPARGFRAALRQCAYEVEHA